MSLKKMFKNIEFVPIVLGLFLIMAIVLSIHEKCMKKSTVQTSNEQMETPRE